MTTYPDTYRPKLRPVEAFPVEQEQETLFCLRDPEEFADRPLLFPLPYVYLISLMDGTCDLAAMRDHFSRRFGGIRLPAARLQELVTQLDTHFFLANERAEAQVSRLTARYLEAEVRPARHAGSAYPGEDFELLEWLDRLYAAAPKASGRGGELRGILVPHIDLRVGAEVYIPAYRSLRHAEPADLYVILGVAHHGDGRYFTATGKDFETPLGRVRTDREVLRLWKEESGADLCEGELAHRVEHSIEFQLPFLQHAMRHPFTILPVLCGPIEPLLAAGTRPQQVAEIARHVEGLAAALGRAGKTVQFILSVDLAHVGPKFGDAEAVTDERAERVRSQDAALLACAAAGSADAWFDALREDQNARRVDAGAAVHTFLWLHRKGRGQVVGYGQNRQPETQSMVTYASMVFHEAARKAVRKG